MTGAQLIPLGAGVLSAFLYLSVSLVSPGMVMLAYFAQAPIAAVGLSQGFMPAAVAGAIAAVVVAIGAPGTGFLTLFVVTSAAPILFVVYLALRQGTGADGMPHWYPPGRILVWLTCIAVAAICVSFVLFSGRDGGLEGAVRRYLAASLSALPASGSREVETMIGMLARVFPAAAAASWIFMIAINTILPQRFLSVNGKNLRPSPPFGQLEIGPWPIAIPAAGALLTFFGGIPGVLGMNILIVGTVPFFFIGLAVLHSISAAWPGRRIFLAGVYIMLVLVLWLAALVAAIGVAEQWLRLRRRMAGRQPPNKGND